MKSLRSPELLLPFCFLITGVLWIIISDRFFLHFQKNPSLSQVTEIQTVKGCLFVIAVTFLLYIGIRASKKKLFQSQEEYKDLFYNTPDPMILFNLKTKKFIDVNKAALATYGYSLKEFLEMTTDDLRTSDPGNEVYNIYRHQKKNKEIITCRETMRKITFKNIHACLLSVHDITELENAKAELINQENQLSLILNSITDGFFILGYNFEVKKGNGLFKKMAEVPVENVEGHKLFHLFPSLKYKLPYKQYSLELQKKKNVYFDTYYSRTKGWYRVSAYPYEGGGFSVFFKDVTREKEDKIQMHQNEQNLLALINTTEDLIWSIDCDFKYFSFNEPFKKWYKLYFNEDVWNLKVAFEHGQESAFDRHWKSLYERALNGEKFSVDMDFEINNKNHHTTVRFNPIYNSNKKIFGVGCFLQNTTESKLHQKKIEQQNLQLREIAFITSHKVRVPVANILGLTEVLDEENPLCEANIKLIGYLKTSAKELDQTITNMTRQTVQIKD